MAKRSVLYLFLATVILSCGETVDPVRDPGNDAPIATQPVPSQLRLETDSLVFNALGANRVIGWSVIDSDGEPVDTATVAWVSSDTLVASVNDRGSVVSTGNGVATVIATSGQLRDSITVSVQQVPASIEVFSRKTDLNLPGDTLTMATFVRDRLGERVVGSNVTWRSSNEATVTISNAGLATATGIGSATITAEADGLQASKRLWVVEDISGGVLIRGVTVLTMGAAGTLTNVDVLVQGGLIQDIGPALSPVDGVYEIDATGRFVMPGLGDMHTHVGLESELTVYILQGVTTILNVGHTPSTPIYSWRSSQRAGDLISPTIYTTGQIIDGANPRQIATIVSDSAAGAAAVRVQSDDGVDAVKVYNSLSPDALSGVINEANSLGLPVVGHGVRSVGLAGMLQMGVRAVAHGEEIFYTHFGSSINPSLTDSATSLLVNQNAWVMPNLSTFARITALWGNNAAFQSALTEPARRLLSPEREGSWIGFFNSTYAGQSGSLQSILDFLRSFTAAMNDAGVKMVLSSDSPVIPTLYPGFSLHEDIAELINVGVSPGTVLEIGTANVGSFVNELGIDTEVFGVLEVGARADLLILGRDPRVDPSSIARNLHGVVFRGRFLGSTRLEQLEADLIVEYGR